ncbi:hypothetical protein N2152v2_006168 [Parachlorella kessleri]
MNQLNTLNSAAYQQLMQDTAEPTNDPKCTKFVMPTEFVMKHMSHLIEKQLQLVDDSDRQFTVTLIQRRNKDKYEYMLSGWRKYGDVNQIREGDTVLFEMLGTSMLKVSVISHGAPMPRATKVKRKRPHNTTESEDEDDDYDGQEGNHSGMPSGASPWQQQGGSAMHAVLGSGGAAQQAQHVQQQQQLSGQPGPSQRPLSPSASGRQQRPPTAAGQPHGTALSPFETAGQQASLVDEGSGGRHVAAGAQLGPSASPLGQLLNMPSHQARQPAAATPADQLAAALTAVQQLELPPAELLALMQGTPNALTDLAPLPSAELLALMQQQMLQAGGGNGEAGGGGAAGGKAGGGAGGAAGLLGGSMAPLVPGLSMQPSVAELAAVVNQLEKQARGEGALQQPGEPPGWEVLLQENVQLREDLQQWKAKVAALMNLVSNAGHTIQRKTDPGLVAMTGVFNAMNQIESPDFLPELPPRSRAVVQEVLGELRQQLNAVLHMVWQVRQLTDELSKELAADEAVVALSKGGRRLPNGL